VRLRRVTGKKKVHPGTGAREYWGMGSFIRVFHGGMRGAFPPYSLALISVFPILKTFYRHRLKSFILAILVGFFHVDYICPVLTSGPMPSDGVGCHSRWDTTIQA
jgi:hypothetical protein